MYHREHKNILREQTINKITNFYNKDANSFNHCNAILKDALSAKKFRIQIQTYLL